MVSRLKSNHPQLSSFIYQYDAEIIELTQYVEHDSLLDIVADSLRSLFGTKTKLRVLMKKLRETCSLIHADCRFFDWYCSFLKVDQNTIMDMFEGYYNATKANRTGEIGTEATHLLMLCVLVKYLPVNFYVFLEKLPDGCTRDLFNFVEKYPVIDLNMMAVFNHVVAGEHSRRLFLTRLDSISRSFNTGRSILLVYDNGRYCYVRPRKKINLSPEYLKIWTDTETFLDRCSSSIDTYRQRHSKEVLNGWDVRLNKPRCGIFFGQFLPAQSKFYTDLHEYRNACYDEYELWHSPYIYSTDLNLLHESMLKLHDLYIQTRITFGDVSSDEDTIQCPKTNVEPDTTMSTLCYVDRRGSDKSVTDLRLEYEDLIKKIAFLRDDEDRLGRNNDRLRRLRADFENDLSKIKENITNFKSELASLKKDVQNERNTRRKIHRENVELNKTKKEDEDFVSQLQKTKTSLDEEFSAQKKNLEVLNEEYTNLLKEKASLLDEIVKLRSDIGEINVNKRKRDEDESTIERISKASKTDIVEEKEDVNILAITNEVVENVVTDVVFRASITEDLSQMKKMFEQKLKTLFNRQLETSDKLSFVLNRLNTLEEKSIINAEEKDKEDDEIVTDKGETS